MIKFFKNFRKDEDGAVTVDWVVLTAAVVTLAIAGITATRTGVMSASDTINSGMSDIEVGATPE